jgi:NitT/TauT family transport system permease protein
VTQPRELEADLRISAPPADWAARRGSYLQRHRSTIRVLLSLAAGLVLWELLGRFVITNRLWFAPLSEVLLALWTLATEKDLANDIYVSGAEFVIGFGLAALIGVGLGIVIGASRRLTDFFDPWISYFYATPLVALTPFFILVFGIGVESTAALVFTLAIFPALINAIAGIQNVDLKFLEVARSFDLTRNQVFTKVYVPASLPFIVSGLRLASGRALIGVVVGELFFSSAGVGHRISEAAQTFNSAQLFAGVLIFALAGVAIMSLLKQIERRLAPWRAL